VAVTRALTSDLLLPAATPPRDPRARQAQGEQRQHRRLGLSSGALHDPWSSSVILPLSATDRSATICLSHSPDRRCRGARLRSASPGTKNGHHRILQAQPGCDWAMHEHTGDLLPLPRALDRGTVRDTFGVEQRAWRAGVTPGVKRALQAHDSPATPLTEGDSDGGRD
jgi:hypothetical protein